MKKITKLLAVLSLAFFAAACSESPMGPQLDDSTLNAAEANWSGSWGGTWDTDKKSPKKEESAPTRRSTGGYALGM